MGTRTIGLRDEVYDRLASEKREGESFSDVVVRLLDERSTDWRHGFGSLDSETAAELERVVAEQRPPTRRLPPPGRRLPSNAPPAGRAGTGREVPRRYLPGGLHPRRGRRGRVPRGDRGRTVRHVDTRLQGDRRGRGARTGADFVEIRSRFGWTDVEPYTVRRAYAAAELETSMRLDGSYREAFAVDLLVAGAAHSLGAPVVTRNTAHFEQFDGLDVESYRPLPSLGDRGPDAIEDSPPPVAPLIRAVVVFYR